MYISSDELFSTTSTTTITCHSLPRPNMFFFPFSRLFIWKRIHLIIVLFACLYFIKKELQNKYTKVFPQTLMKSMMHIVI